MRLTAFKLLLAVGLFFALFFIPQIVPKTNAQEYKKYLNVICTASCFQCSAGKLSDELKAICQKHTYNDINLCREKCLPSKISEAEENGIGEGMVNFMDECSDCLKQPDKCKDKKTEHLCKSIHEEKDPVSLMANYNLLTNDKDKNAPLADCPSSMKPDASGKKCECSDPSMEFDSLHTACLHKQTAVDNINTLFAFLPESILNGIKYKVLQDINESIDKDASFLPDEVRQKLKSSAGSISSKLMSDASLAQFVYTSLIANTDNLRQLIRELGRSKTEKLIEILEMLTSDQKEKTQEPTSQKEPVSNIQTNKKIIDRETQEKINEIMMKQKQLSDEKWTRCEVALAMEEGESCESTCGKGETIDPNCYIRCKEARGCFVCTKDSDCEGVYDSTGLKSKCETKVHHTCEPIYPE